MLLIQKKRVSMVADIRENIGIERDTTMTSGLPGRVYGRNE